MNRPTAIAIWFVVIVVASFALYRVKYEVQAIRSQITETAQQLEQEKEEMHVVAAEWAYLNRPERLQQLSDRYLTNSEMTVSHIAEVEAIAFPHQSQAANEPANAATPASFHKGSTTP